MAGFSRLTRAQLDQLAGEFGIDASGYKNADELRSALEDEVDADELSTAAASLEGTNAEEPAEPVEDRDVDAAGADIASSTSTGNDETFEAADATDGTRREVTNPDGEKVFVTVIDETDAGTVVREDGTNRRFTL
jgi:hypothetical protein